MTLPVQEQIAAGGLTPAPLRSGHIAKIMTGAPIPDGTEAVVPVEATTGGPDQVTIDRPPRPAANIRRAGEDVARGERGNHLPLLHFHEFLLCLEQFTPGCQYFQDSARFKLKSSVEMLTD